MTKTTARVKDDELVGILAAISVVSKRLARRIALLNQAKGGKPNGAGK